MRLKDYINDYGQKKMAAKLDVDVSTVYRWEYLETAPVPEVAYKIVQLTHGLVDWNDIYQPYFDNKFLNQNENQLTFEDLK